MTRTPPEPPEEELDELDDEAIVAQQSAAHAPQRRAQVKVESRSVVVADDDAEATRQLQIYSEGSADPTVVVRDRERRALAQAVDELPVRRGRKSWVTLAIWGGAGLAALGLGAVLGMLHGEPATTKQIAVSASQVAAPPAPAPPEHVAAQGGGEDAAAAPPASSGAEQALAPDQLPVEPGKRHKSTFHAHRHARPASHATPKPAAPRTQPEKGAIPSGI